MRLNGKTRTKTDSAEVEFFVDLRNRTCRIVGMDTKVFALLFLPGTLGGVCKSIGDSRLTVRGESSVVEARLHNVLNERIESRFVRSVYDLLFLIVLGSENVYISSRLIQMERS